MNSWLYAFTSIALVGLALTCGIASAVIANRYMHDEQFWKAALFTLLAVLFTAAGFATAITVKPQPELEAHARSTEIYL